MAKSRDRFDPNSQDCGSQAGGMENMLKAPYSSKGNSRAQTNKRGSSGMPNSAPRNAKRLRG